MMTKSYPLLPLLALGFALLAGGAGAQTHTPDSRIGGDVPPCGMNGWQATARIGGEDPPLGSNGWHAPQRRPLPVTVAARQGIGGDVPPAGSNGWTRSARPLPLSTAQ